MKKISLSMLGFCQRKALESWTCHVHTIIYDFQWGAIVVFLSMSFSACLETGDKRKIQILFLGIVIFYFVSTDLLPLPLPYQYSDDPLSLRFSHRNVTVSHNLVLLVYSVAAVYLCKFKHTERVLKCPIPVRNICTYVYLNVFVEAWMMFYAFQP